MISCQLLHKQMCKTRGKIITLYYKHVVIYEVAGYPRSGPTLALYRGVAAKVRKGSVTSVGTVLQSVTVVKLDF